MSKRSFLRENIRVYLSLFLDLLYVLADDTHIIKSFYFKDPKL